MNFDNAPLIQAATGQVPTRVPVWFMRQAGRSLPEYFKVRGEGSILQAISVPERAAEITLQPTRRYDVDAAILFSDIITPLWAIDFGVDIKPGVGPVTEISFRSSDDLKRFRPLDPDKDMPFQRQAIEQLIAELKIPLIGFCGAPFTLATYLIEGKPSKNHAITKELMFTEPKLWHKLCDQLADIVIASLAAQVEAGASAVQLFDSWAGILAPAHYAEFVFPHSRKILEALEPLGVPRFHFGTNTAELLDQFADAGAEVVGVDWRTPLSVARERIAASNPDSKKTVALQGNLDPTLCSSAWPIVEAEAKRILDNNAGNPAHIFNLGHGVLPTSDPEILAKLADYVHDYGTGLLRPS